MQTRIEEEKLPIHEFKWHVTEENGEKFMRATIFLPEEFSVMGAGLLGSLGDHDLGMKMEFGGGCSHLSFKAACARGCSSGMTDDFVVNKDAKQFRQSFLSYFCGANLKFQFTSVEEAVYHEVASPLLKIQDNFVKKLLEDGQKITRSTKEKNSHLKLLQHVLEYFGKNQDLLGYFKAVWEAIKYGKVNLDHLSVITVLVGNELYQVDFKDPHLLELLPTYQDMENSQKMEKENCLKPKFVITKEDAGNLPLKVVFQGHNSRHQLELKSQLFDWVEEYWCDDCGSLGKGWCYHCDQCMYVVHPEHIIAGRKTE